MQLPLEFETRMRRLLGERYTVFADCLTAPLTTRGVRVNTLKCTAESLCRHSGLSLTPTPFCADGFVTDTVFRAGVDPWHHAGAYYMQEPSAMSAVTLLDVKAGERVLDLCAAPGGKSTQIAAALQGDGLLWANEYVPNRARVLAQNMERCGVRNAVVSCGDTARLAEALPEWFDAVLADIPCSGEGMFRKEEEALSGWSMDNIRLCAERGAEILHNAAQCVRAGGRLVMSTCTFAPEENEWAVVRFLRDHPDFKLETADVPFGEAAFDAECIASFGEEALLPFARTVPLSRCRRIFPWHGGEGHFLALFRRAGESTPPPVIVKGMRDRTGAVDAAQALYEECFREAPRGTFVCTGDTVRLLPPAYPATSGVHILTAGLAVAQVITGRQLRVEPAHAVFQAAHPSDCRRILLLKRDDPRTTAFLRGEELAVDLESGWTAVAVDGVTVGFGKVSGGKLKNRYPKGLRLLQR